MCPFLLHLFHCFFFFFNDTATTEIYTLSLHDALPISRQLPLVGGRPRRRLHGARHRARDDGASRPGRPRAARSEEHTSELQSLTNLVCRLLLEKKKHKRAKRKKYETCDKNETDASSVI